MQFIFGDDTSKYTMLFFDDKADNATKIKDMVRLPYSPNPEFDALGFIPFGINNNRALFFKFQKDTKMVRNVYVLHGVYGDADPDYFFSEEYVKGIFTGFIDQTGFDAIRDAQLAKSKDLSVPYFCEEKLAATPYSSITIDPIILHEILSKLYQRTRVVLVMDDEKFNNDTARLLIKKIFSFLTPSLRKVCSYITAVDSTGDMEFLLRIIPRSMMEKDEVVIDLDAPATPYSDKTEFPELVKTLLEMSEGQRALLFEHFELLHYGKDSIYKKQNFQIFFESYMAAELTDEVIVAYDKILGDYLADGKCPDDAIIPDFMQKALYPLYSSERLLDSRIDWDSERLDTVGAFYNENVDIIEKVFYLCDKELAYFENKLKERYESPCFSKDIETIKALCNAINEEDLLPRDSAQPAERKFLAIAMERYRYLVKLCNEYDDAVSVTENLFNRFIEKRFKDVRIGDIEEQVQLLINGYMETQTVYERITDIREHLAYRIQTECIDTHNAEYDRMVQCAQEEKARAERKQTLDTFVTLLHREEILKKEAYERALAEKAEAEKAKKQKKKPAKEETSENVDEFDVYMGGEEETASDEMPTVEENVEASLTEEADCAAPEAEEPTLQEPSYDELLAVATDEEFSPELAKALASYLLNVCLMTKEPTFPAHDRLLMLVDHEETLTMAAKQLCEKEHPEFALLYLAAYTVTPDTAIATILHMEEIEAIDSKRLAQANKFLPHILEEKSLDFVLSDEAKTELSAFAEELCKNKETPKAKKAICKILLASPFFCQPTEGKKTPSVSLPVSGKMAEIWSKIRPDTKNKRAVWIIAIVDVVVLALIALIVTIIILTGGKDDAVTTDPASPQASPSATESVVTESGDPASEPATPDPVTPTASVPEDGGDTQQGT